MVLSNFIVIYQRLVIVLIKAVIVLFRIYKLEKAKALVDKFFIMKEKNETSQITPVKFLKIIIYILVMFILGLVLFLLSLKSVLRYNEWPIYTETNIVNQNKARFPAMTFCPLSNGYKRDVLKVMIRPKHVFSLFKNLMLSKKIFSYR